MCPIPIGVLRQYAGAELPCVNINSSTRRSHAVHPVEEIYPTMLLNEKELKRIHATVMVITTHITEEQNLGV